MQKKKEKKKIFFYIFYVYDIFILGAIETEKTEGETWTSIQGNITEIMSADEKNDEKI